MIPVVVGSSPISHPKKNQALSPALTGWAFCFLGFTDCLQTACFDKNAKSGLGSALQFSAMTRFVTMTIMTSLVRFFLLCLMAGSSLAQSSLPACKGIEMLEWTDCIGVINQPDFVFIGEWKNGSVDGHGTFTSTDGEKYVGEFKGNKRNGQGTLTFADGDKYVGEFKDGRYSGRGELTYADGHKYVGEFKDGQFSGWGEFNYPNGHQYIGEFKDGDYSGKGTENFANGDKYVGEFKDDKRHGQGTLTFVNGHKYIGEFKGGNYSGQGTLIYANGEKYVGQWEMNNRSGQGIMTYANGSQYIGEFKDDERNGQGTLTIADGDRYIGEFKNDKRYGQGKIIYANGAEYVGEFKDGQNRRGKISQAFGGKKDDEHKDENPEGQKNMTNASLEEYIAKSKDAQIGHSKSADPFVFIVDNKRSENHAWWIKSVVVRPRGTSVSGVSLKEINEARSDSFSEWCFADALTRKSFSSPVESIRAEIDESMWDENLPGFKASGAFTGGSDQEAVVGNYEDCNGQQGAFILISDRSQPKKVVYVREWNDWTGFIWLKMDKSDDSLRVGSCMYCGDWSELSYDIKRKRFYWIHPESR